MNIVVLTGAGISAESGLATFRDLGGIWSQVNLEEVATPEAFAADPERVQSFYNARRAQLHEVEPNAAHHALVRLEREWRKGSFLLVTQNVDDLHDRAGSQALLHMHGELRRVRCLACGTDDRWEGPVTSESACPSCRTQGRLRPHVVWFGETPLHMEQIEAALEGCDLFIAIGTSAQVWPAAGFVRMLPRRAWGIEINPERSAMASSFAEGRRGPATRELPLLVEELLA
ncbi:NAD-dependent deacylase [Sabulicella rubraurantiaca]|uniref:NAD-dependent deacylase n=1 Tax=Sabulicella rubraurantiaca TaxID=2811429 RepID=UPI001A9650A4|nr:NAD-dependent deacylase [Sabulicella rubraurantiaca]